VSGDEALCEEIYQQIGDVPRIVTKKALNYNAVCCRDNNSILKELNEKTIETLNNPVNWVINKVAPPYTLKVGFTKVVMADMAELIPCVNRTGVTEIEFTHPDFTKVYHLIQAISVMSDSAKNYY